MDAAKQYPTDKSTVISIAPFGGEEFKPGLYPGRFIIPPCKDDSIPVTLVVSASQHILQIPGKKQGVQIVTPSFEIARSIAQDYLDGQLFASPEAHPGIMWVPGVVTVEEFKIKHKEEHKAMQECQRRWFALIVQKTQDDWNRYRNSRVVSDQARFAVRALEIPTPEWMQVDEMIAAPSHCPACGTVVRPSIAWCPNCIQGGVKVIINAEAAKLVKIG